MKTLEVFASRVGFCNQGIRGSNERVDFLLTHGKASSIITLIDSSFNASPASMKMALDTLSGYGGRRIAVLGDTLELGAYANRLHAEIGAYATSGKADVLIAVGEYADATLGGLRDGNVAALKCADCSEAFESVVEIIRECRNTDEKCVVMCKGSHGSKLYELAAKLKEL